MIFVLERPEGGQPRAWFAFDARDLLLKLAADDLQQLRDVQLRKDASDPRVLAQAVLDERGQGGRIWWDEAQAMAAFERTDDPLWRGQGWRARLALREQLIALEVLADDA